MHPQLCFNALMPRIDDLLSLDIKCRDAVERKPALDYVGDGEKGALMHVGGTNLKS